MNILVSGGWSYGNIGDEAIAASTNHLIKEFFPKANVIVSAYNPDDYKFHHRVRALQSVHRIIEQCASLENIHEITESPEKYGLMRYVEQFQQSGSTVLFMSGGGYFNQGWVSRALAVIVEIQIAVKEGAQVVCLGQSIGPFPNPRLRSLVVDTLNKCSYVSVRDYETAEYLTNIGVNNVQIGSDLAAYISDIYPAKRTKSRKKIINVTLSPYSVYQPSDGRVTTQSYYEKLINISAKLRYSREIAKTIGALLNSADFEIRFIPSTTWQDDVVFVNQILKKGKQRSSAKIYSGLRIEELCTKLSEGSLMLSSKMHPLIISSAYGIETIGISYNYKLDSYMHSIGRADYCFRNSDIRAGVLLKIIKQCLDRGTLASNVTSKNKELIIKDFKALRNILSIES